MTDLMTDWRPVKTALLSVSDKTNIIDLAKALDKLKVQIISTGGTARMLESEGIAVTPVSDVTGFPEILDGRVKTLHPKIHGGLLADRNNPDHVATLEDLSINSIDLVVVNLYPFEQTVSSTDNAKDIIENIDIGGPCMIRAAAKNHDSVCVVTSPQDYAALTDELQRTDGQTSQEFRQTLAAKAFAHTANYDSAIAGWFARDSLFPQDLFIRGHKVQDLRYGENPHQSAAVYKSKRSTRGSLLSAVQVQGKELSYNNLNDADAALNLVSEFSEPAVAIIKHANPCGVAVGMDTLEAWQKALACDTVSAFGGIVAVNRPVDKALATAMAELFLEVIIAPGLEPEAADVLAAKKNLRVLQLDSLPDPTTTAFEIKALSGGYLMQTQDNTAAAKADLKTVTKRAPSDQELSDLLFAERVAKHVKSNAIVFVKNGATVGIGAGQMSRVDSVHIGHRKAETMRETAGESAPRTKGAVAASDAFFPFADGLLGLVEAGVTAVVQPGGSKRDDEVIAAADEHDLAMVFTGTRHFKH